MEIKFNKEISLGNNIYLSFLVVIENPGILSLPPVATTHCLAINPPKQSDVLSRPVGSLYFFWNPWEWWFISPHDILATRNE